MIREITSLSKFYLCQCSNWQVVVQADCEEDAVTKAIEFVMTEDSEKVKLSAGIYVRKMPSFIDQKEIEPEETLIFYVPMIMANAGFHAEASKLQNFLDTIQDEEENEQ
jgi:hypothetical protein